MMNKYQTIYNEEYFKTVPKEVRNEFYDCIENIPFVKWLIQDESIRGFAKDRPKHKDLDKNDPKRFYNDARIVVDLVKPHILEDVDFFRERAIYFEKHKKYTSLVPNPNPKSDYRKFWKEEVRRWRDGLVRPSDGEWIPGGLYFYWNYCPIWQTLETGIDKGGKSRGERIYTFPKPWLGDYLFYHYMEQGREAGQHGKLLKTRGVGFLEPNDSILQQSTGTILVGDVKVGDNLLDRYGNNTKVLEVYPQGLQEIYLVEFSDGRSVECGLDHLWSVYDKNKGSKNKNVLYTYKTSELIEKGLAWKNKNGNNLYKFYVPDLAEPVKYEEQNLVIPPYVIGALLGDGSMSTKSIKIASDDIEIIDKIQSDLGSNFILNKDSSNNNYRIVYKHLYDISNSNIRINPLKRHLVENNWNFTTSTKFIPEIYKYSSYDQRLELVKGLMDTDGSISKNGNLEFSNSNETLVDDLASVLRSMGISCTKGLGRAAHQKEIKGELCNIKQEYRLYIRTNLNLFNLTRKSDRVKTKKLFLNNPIINIKKLSIQKESTCFLVDNDEHLYLTGDFIPTHNSFKLGSLSPRNMYVFPGSGNPNFHLASDKTFLSGDKGVFGKVIDTLDWIATHTPLPKLRLSDSKKAMEIQLGYLDPYGVRKGLLSSVYGISMKDNPDKARGIRGAMIHYEEDGVFPNLESTWNINRKATEDGNVAFSYQLAGGTGGSESADFTGSEKLFYNPTAYNIYGVENVYDKNLQNPNLCGFFWGAYLNRNKCYDLPTGEPDVTKALVEIIKNRVETRSKATDTKTITQNAAEECITPQDAVMRIEGTIFPVTDIKNYLGDISGNLQHFVSGHYIGELVPDNTGEIVFKHNTDLYPIRDFPALDNKLGAIEIFELPQKIVDHDRYIIGVDTYDDDEVTYSDSLGSCIVFDRWTRRIVAEYTGRPKYADDFYEICYRLSLFYDAKIMYENNKKGLFGYFNNVKRALSLLADTPTIITDRQDISVRGMNNTSKGINATKAINMYGLKLQVDWMREEAYNEERVDLSEEEIEVLPFIANLQKIRSIGYLKETAVWNSKINADRVSAMNMVMIFDAELDQFNYEKHIQEQSRFSNDPFMQKFKVNGNMDKFGYKPN